MYCPASRLPGAPIGPSGNSCSVVGPQKHSHTYLIHVHQLTSGAPSAIELHTYVSYGKSYTAVIEMSTPCREEFGVRGADISITAVYDLPYGVYGYFKKIHNYRHAISTSAALDIVVGNVGNIHGNIRKLTSPAYKNCQPAMKWKMVDLVRRRGQGAMGA